MCIPVHVFYEKSSYRYSLKAPFLNLYRVHTLGFLMKAKMLTVSSMTLLVLLFGIYCNVETVVLDSVVTVQENFNLEYHLCEATDQLQP